MLAEAVVVGVNTNNRGRTQHKLTSAQHLLVKPIPYLNLIDKHIYHNY